MAGIRRVIGEYGVWACVALAITVVVAAATGWWLLLVYGGLNVVGSVLYLDGIDRHAPSTRARRRWMPILTVLQLPVGIVGLLASKGSGTPSDDLVGSEELRNDAGGLSNIYGMRKR